MVGGPAGKQCSVGILVQPELTQGSQWRWYLSKRGRSRVRLPRAWAVQVFAKPVRRYGGSSSCVAGLVQVPAP